MKPETAKALDKARTCLTKAEQMLAIDLADEAARSAYMAAFHAAQALVFERTGKVAKTHAGVRIEFSRLAKDEAGFDRALISFLGQSYEFKTISDYGVDPGVTITAEHARNAITTATRFVEGIGGLVGPLPDLPA